MRVCLNTFFFLRDLVRATAENRAQSHPFLLHLTSTCSSLTPAESPARKQMEADGSNVVQHLSQLAAAPDQRLCLSFCSRYSVLRTGFWVLIWTICLAFLQWDSTGPTLQAPQGMRNAQMWSQTVAHFPRRGKYHFADRNVLFAISVQQCSKNLVNTNEVER